MTDTPAWPAAFRVGNWTDAEAGTGCTVIIPPAHTVAAVDIRGGGPGTRETDLLSPDSPFVGVSAILLTGGSAFGLNATSGVVRWCLEQGIGYDVSVARVPVVPTAVIFDLGISDNLRHPEPDDAFAACAAAVAEAPLQGSVGAGTGATVGKLLGRGGWCKGGLGVAGAVTTDGATVAVLVVVNAFGDIVGEDGRILAGAWRSGEGFVDARRAGLEIAPEHPRLVSNTTLVTVLTDAALTKSEAAQVARAASAGVARAIAPVHTPMDGDVTFVLAAGHRRSSSFVVGSAAASLTAAAIRSAVRAATPVRSVPTAGDRRTAG
jgi:L-aminopeptidase/D-esterase-like protein